MDKEPVWDGLSILALNQYNRSKVVIFGPLVEVFVDYLDKSDEQRQ